MNCPNCKTEIDDGEIARYLAAKGGRTTGKSKARDSSKMRDAALKRWAKSDALLDAKPKTKQTRGEMKAKSNREAWKYIESVVDSDAVDEIHLIPDDAKRISIYRQLESYFGLKADELIAPFKSENKKTRRIPTTGASA